MVNFFLLNYDIDLLRNYITQPEIKPMPNVN